MSNPRNGRLRRERMILATLATIGERKLKFGSPEMGAAFAELEADLAAIGQSPPIGWEIKALLNAERARLTARIERRNAVREELQRLSRHAKAMGLGPGDE